MIGLNTEAGGDVAKRLMIEAIHYHKLIKEHYPAKLVVQSDGLLVYTAKEEQTVLGEAHLNNGYQWTFLDNLNSKTWIIRADSIEGIYQALLYGYLCKIGVMGSEWNVPIEHFRCWMRDLEKREN